MQLLDLIKVQLSCRRCRGRRRSLIIRYGAEINTLYQLMLTWNVNTCKNSDKKHVHFILTHLQNWQRPSGHCQFSPQVSLRTITRWHQECRSSLRTSHGICRTLPLQTWAWKGSMTHLNFKAMVNTKEKLAFARLMLIHWLLSIVKGIFFLNFVKKYQKTVDW